MARDRARGRWRREDGARRAAGAARLSRAARAAGRPRSGIFAFAALELVASNGDQPETVAIATLIYSALTFIAMALYGVDSWIERGEAFSVYFNLFSRMSAIETRDRVVGLRRPLSGLPALADAPGDGGAAGRDDRLGHLRRRVGGATLDRDLPRHRAASSRMSAVAPARARADLPARAGRDHPDRLRLLPAGVLGARSVGGGFSARRLANEFVHTLVPIALAYVAAHYLTLLLFQGQAIAYLASDPLGDGSDLFGTADSQIDYGIIGANATWYWQVAFVVAGHVAALVLAHDRALALYDDAKLAVRSQYWMLAVMVGFTSLALWLLSRPSGPS